MSISPEHAGRTYAPLKPYVVARAKVDEFLRALDEDNPAYGGDAIVAPPTFSAVATFDNWQQLIDDPELGLALRFLIHADQTFELSRLPVVGDVLSGWTILEDVKIRGHLEYLYVRVDVRDQTDEIIGRSRATFIHNRAAADEAAAADQTAAADEAVAS
jgi:hypothetical protein